MRPLFLIIPGVLAGCQAPSPIQTADEPPSFAFVRGRYDADGDGKVSPEEYRREGGEFMRLDRNGDGALGADDFRLAGRRMLGLPPSEARRQRARHLLAWYFQRDSDVHRVEWSELEEAWEEFDGDGDGRVGRSEFEALAREREGWGRSPAGRWAGLIEIETTDPWERILQGVDKEEDGFLSEAELRAFFDETAALDGWAFDSRDGAPVAQSLTGAPAPALTLPSLDDGADPVELGAHGGAKPVALIFGSYT